MLGLFQIVDHFIDNTPVFGVCLGMQAIVEYLGGSLIIQDKVKHGIQEEIHLNDGVLFKTLPKKIKVGLYHSWSTQIDDSIDLKITSKSKSEIIMSLENKTRRIYYVHFHPESVLTPYGMEIVKNFLENI